MTRAKILSFITYPLETTLWGRFVQSTASRFIESSTTLTGAETSTEAAPPKHCREDFANMAKFLPRPAPVYKTLETNAADLPLFNNRSTNPSYGGISVSQLLYKDQNQRPEPTQLASNAKSRRSHKRDRNNNPQESLNKPDDNEKTPIATPSSSARYAPPYIPSRSNLQSTYICYICYSF